MAPARTDLYSDPGNDFVSSADDGAVDYVDCGDGHDTGKRGSDTNLDRFVGCEEFVNQPLAFGDQEENVGSANLPLPAFVCAGR